MNNKIIGIILGVLILGVVIFSGMNNPEMSPSQLAIKGKSTGLTNPDVMPVGAAFLNRDCPGGIDHVQQGDFHGGGSELQCIGNHGYPLNFDDCSSGGVFDIYDGNGNVIGMGC
ncbi:hypothetical protein HON86_00495 [Candidatus Woesearchaeota archaeon]|jgi:hypothetical protein|nr:hypothetical protein [Candidatus Woesearchaeota archaeon]MBT4835086.1 hypothetical protein [Candidatus Woesearchaeota archaeon]MBT6734788.1 hypothetical protein [Candidatus Woesearchaeota archaeon]MBT7170029.1 hypothetical protein [Candidatus Woesearchaeota archaeon]MBT7474876.1 hypothetical protein [Candidatus Woesearchaeota archaeon]